MMNKMFYIVTDGLLFEARMIDCPEGDAFARANKRNHVEQITKDFDMKLLRTDSSGKIEKEWPLKPRTDYNKI